MVVNNRPDGEEPGQPLAADIEAAAEAAGISYRHVPIIRGIGPADVAAMRDALRAAGDGQTLAFCRSGNRSALGLGPRHARGRRFGGGDRAEGDRRRLRRHPDRAPALAIVLRRRFRASSASSSRTMTRTPTMAPSE